MDYRTLLVFLEKCKAENEDVFIEAEGIPNRLINFINEYNASYTPLINKTTEGIIVLQEDANKWGLELRLYVKSSPPSSIIYAFTQNRVYRTEYKYRLNNNDVIMHLFSDGFRIGVN